MERILDRTVRAASSGMLGQLIREEKVGDHQVVSLLLSSGTYAAMKSPDGPIAEGSTRDEAIAKLKELLG
jgi:hypothetical protein